MEKALAIGKASSNHLAIDDPSVSAQHAKIVNQGETFLLKDLGSEQGTFVNGTRITQKPVVCGDKITIGAVQLEVIDPIKENGNNNYWSLIADSSWLSGQEFPIIAEVDQVVTVGRSPKCNIVFPGTHLSRLHAEITVNSASLNLRDMGSANGTFVNDKKVDNAQIYAGDRVRLDVYSFRVFGPGIKLPQSATTSINAVPAIEELERSVGPKQWKSKPTSPGNREEINLYKKHYRQVLLAGLVIVGLLAAVTYVGLGIVGVI